MKKIILFNVLLLVFVSAPVFGGITLDVTRHTGYYTSPGGEFTIVTDDLDVLGLYDEDAKVGDGFQSFCLEGNEGLGAKTFDAILNNGAVAGGVGGAAGGKDIISQATAWLYQGFAKGVLSGYDYTPGAGRAAEAYKLQKAFWFLEDEIASIPIAEADYVNMAISQFGSLNNAKADYTGGAVAVLNLYAVGHAGDPQYLKQDQLVLIPAPGALLLCGIGLMTVRRFRDGRALLER